MENDPVTKATDSVKSADRGEEVECITNEPAVQSTDNVGYDENNTPVVEEYMEETEEETSDKGQLMDTNVEMAKEMLNEPQAMEIPTDSYEQKNQQESMEVERTVVSEEHVKILEEPVIDGKKHSIEKQVTKCLTSEETVTEYQEKLTEEKVTPARTSEETYAAVTEQMTEKQVTKDATSEETVTEDKGQGTVVQVTTDRISDETISEVTEQETKEEVTNAEISQETVTEERELTEGEVTKAETKEEIVTEDKLHVTLEKGKTFVIPEKTFTEEMEHETKGQVTTAVSEENPTISKNLQSNPESPQVACEGYPLKNETAVPHDGFPLPHKTSTIPPSESSLGPEKEPLVPNENSPLFDGTSTSPPCESSLDEKGPPVPHDSTPLQHEASIPPETFPLHQENSVLPEKQAENNELEQLTNQSRNEQAISDNESLSNDAKVPERTEIKVNEEFKKLNQIISEETSNSSWYKMPENKEETMDIAETGLLGDENSNMSIPENASVVSSNIGDNSVLSYQVDEGSNLSIPDDGNSVPKFSGHQPVFDESANMNPPSNVTFIQPDTPGSVNADTMSEATPTSKRLRRGTLQIAAEDSKEHGHNITAADIYEYQWPQENDADWFILQEQISVYLDVKSFKRKYPEIFRRVCDKLEKDFLREKGVVTETQSDLGLTALKSEDVHDLMSRDYPAKYKEFFKILHEREKKRIAEKMKEYDAPRLEKEKMIEYTKRAMKSASDWNRKMLKERSKERRAYFDMQTFVIHYPKGKFRKLENIWTPKSSYPVSLIPGQFQEHYRKYEPGDLRHFPLNTTVYNPPKKVDPVARLQQQIVRRQKQQLTQPQSETIQRNVQERSVIEELRPEILSSGNGLIELFDFPAVLDYTSPYTKHYSVTTACCKWIEEKEKTRPNRAGVEGDTDNESNNGTSSAGDVNKEKETQDEQEGKPEDKAVEKLKKKEKSTSREASKEKSVEPLIIKKESIECRICKDQKDKSKVPVGEGLITCSECHRAGHPSCLDLTDSMVMVIKTYPWQCMECKTCVQCMDPYDEDKMLFCDNCDRGYHTFCVGLKSLPMGKWECKSCTGDTTPITPLPRPPPKAKRGRKPKDPNNPASTPAKGQKEKDKDKENSVKQTPTRYIPRRESRTQENPKDPKESKETK